MFTPFNDARLTPPSSSEQSPAETSSPNAVSLRPGTPAPSQLTTLSSLLLRRLNRLVRVESEWRPRVADDDWRIKLIHKSIYSTYCDCVGEGIAEQAKAIVRTSRDERLS